jgi:predicted transcriptional regulator
MEERGMASVRVEPKLHEKLRALSAAERRSISSVIEDAVNRYEQEKFWTAMHESFSRLRADPAAWSEYQDEAALWDSATGDGLENEEPYTTDEEEGDAFAATTAPG